MTHPVSHTAPKRASADNRWAIHSPKNNHLSTTRLLRHAHHVSGGDLAKALDSLRALAADYSNAWSAIRVLRSKLAKHPGCDVFTITGPGIVRLSRRPAPAREVFTLVIGDLRFERSGDSMAVYRFDERVDRIDLPAAGEFAFFRAAHDYCAAIATREVA
ncbi:MAG TPA: hypothetical protein VJP85_05690 [Candidatus Baltobacteraceae bacterium]|nr:hypothetical protein [Candidatus Baltobacteraceae bacterium]